MKNFLPRYSPNLFRVSILAGTIYFADRCVAQDNVWTSVASGNWQDASWSLGILPATNQTIWITNAGWKAVQIGAATAQIFPQSLNVNAINISSPTNSFNTLLLNFAGAQTPLTVKTLTVASNSAMTMISSGLQINGPDGSGMMIGGQFDQNDSVVSGNQVNVGYVGPGVYNFNSGYFTVSQLWLGGNTPGVFNQNGGTNGFGITHLDGGTYVLSNGWYSAAIYFDTFGKFHQQGGTLASDLTIFNGDYVLAGGVHQGWTEVPSPNGYTEGLATMQQTGGTNNGLIEIGSYGTGIYTMSNGVCNAPGFSVGPEGVYSQQDGTLQVSGVIGVGEEQIAPGALAVGQFNLSGGQVSSSGLYLQGFYSQTGGTNLTAGDITMNNMESSVTLSSGLLTADNFIENPGFQGGVSLTGGTLIITNDLFVGGINLPNWRGFSCGSQLFVSNIRVAPLGIFSCGGTIVQSGVLTLTNASLYSGSNCVQLGSLRLATGGTTNSTLYMTSPTSIMSFNDSSSVTWSSEPMLIIEGWSGSLNGGGSQEIIFGNNSNSLTSTQLAHIQFHNPARLTNGMYPARILASGEIVPATAEPAVANMALQPQPGGMLVTLRGEAGRTYLIETSTDMVHWAPWTNQFNATGTMTVTDTDSTNYPTRFYRAQLVP